MGWLRATRLRSVIPLNATKYCFRAQLWSSTNIPLENAARLREHVQAESREPAGSPCLHLVGRYDATNEMFTGAYVEYALALAEMMAHKPDKLTHVVPHPLFGEEN